MQIIGSIPESNPSDHSLYLYTKTTRVCVCDLYPRLVTAKKLQIDDRMLYVVRKTTILTVVSVVTTILSLVIYSIIDMVFVLRLDQVI